MPKPSCKKVKCLLGLFCKPQVRDAEGIVEGPADDAQAVDHVQQNSALTTGDARGLWVDVGAGVGGSVLQHVGQQEHALILDHVEQVALSALAPLRPGAGLPTCPSRPASEARGRVPEAPRRFRR